MDSILVLHGPNLNLLGLREPGVYGNLTLADIDQRLVEAGQQLGVEVRAYQSNHEEDLIEHLHEAREWAAGVVFNPAGYTHTSKALGQAVSDIGLPVVEVHISNVYARESFRHISLLAPYCAGKITGFGWRSYLLGLYAVLDLIKDRKAAGPEQA